MCEAFNTVVISENNEIMTCLWHSENSEQFPLVCVHCWSVQWLPSSSMFQSYVTCIIQNWLFLVAYRRPLRQVHKHISGFIFHNRPARCHSMIRGSANWYSIVNRDITLFINFAVILKVKGATTKRYIAVESVIFRRWIRRSCSPKTSLTHWGSLRFLFPSRPTQTHYLSRATTSSFHITIDCFLITIKFDTFSLIYVQNR